MTGNTSHLEFTEGTCERFGSPENEIPEKVGPTKSDWEQTTSYGLVISAIPKIASRRQRFKYYT